MDSCNIDIVRYTDGSKEFRFTNKNTIEFLRNNISTSFSVTVKVVFYVNKKNF